MKRNCDNCGKEYTADMRNVRRGWGLCCSKSCAASKREKAKTGYDPVKVARNNIKRKFWNSPISEESYYGTYRGRRTSEGYKIYERENDEFTAVDEFDDPVYDGTFGIDDPGDSEYWDNKEF